ncbi:MAG TPA: 5-oxoprolinase [Deltaproteobacteria bacterium]|nr:5-oxoprolinase [Deltaproteobacteria bacterium]
MPLTCVDRGGTFTDVVTVHDDGRVTVRKVPSDTAVVGALAEGALTFGTTVATNALLERSGVPTLLIVTRGFADLVRIGDMTRPQLFDPDAVWPEPLCQAVLEIDGRIDANGREIEPLILPSGLDLDGIEAVAVVLLNSCRDPAHELAVADWIADLPSPPGDALFVSLGHLASPEVGYLARIETTLVDASITPILQRAMARDRIGADALAVRSDGSLVPSPDLRAPDAVLSGPAGGVVAVAAVARQAGIERAVGLDMGGTSTDVCLVSSDRLPRRGGEHRVAGIRLRRPTLEIDTIAAGGGSVLWSDGLRLGVGPRSAGADPGPQCYGRGGPPTLTDAALAAGLIDPRAFDPPLDPAAIDLPADAGAFLEVARGQMAAAIRRLAARRGLDVRDHDLVAFGGAAGQHAAPVAALLGIRQVWVHPCAAALSAWGQALARREEAAVIALWAPLDRCWPEVIAAWSRLEATLPRLGEVARSVELRHTGTDDAIEVFATDPDTAQRAFRVQHRARYGFDRSQPLEVVNARIRTWAPAPQPPQVPDDPFGLGDTTVEGPIRLDATTTSVWVPEGWSARCLRGLLQLVHDTPAPHALPTERTPHAVALWSSRLAAVAAGAGVVLERTARSVNIRERRDFSCAVFDARGQLIANAPHVPVHLGAMGVTVRDLIAQVPDLDRDPDQHWLCNDPMAGGSHLPDLTVIHPVVHEGHRAFVACRGHHVDVGGTTPGSMPPRSTTLAQEGFVVRHLPLLQDGQLRMDLEAHLVGCRQLGTVRADLEAQIASNAVAARLLRQLGPAALVARWMAHLQDVAAESVASVLDRLPRDAAASDRIGGVPLAVTLRRDEDALVVDFSGTGGPSTGNLNAPPAVVRAAVLYALRVLAGREIPLNEGALRYVSLIVPPGSILDPPPGAAIAGGNVETSQRLVDLLLRAAGYLAASAGTMSNLTLGGERWSLYETVGGGQGASPRGPGASGRQLHMTNTRATDPEILEARLPLRVRRFALRAHSGGAGVHPGGQGLIREIEVTEAATAALLATRRSSGAAGLGAGGPGAPGQDATISRGTETPWDGDVVQLSPGDRVRVCTPGGGGWAPADKIPDSPEE